MSDRNLDAEAAGAGIHRLSIPTPFAIGRVNCYVIDDDPLTLIDAGPNSSKSLEELTRGISALGYRLEALGRLVITHQHIDHLGLIGEVAARSGAEVVALDALVPFAQGYSEEAEADDQFAAEVMLANGVPEDLVSALRSVSRAYRAWGAGAEVTRAVSDGDSLEFGDRTLEIHHRPGHSPTDTVFHDADRRMLIAADHLLPQISSNPLITRPPDGSGERPKALEIYIESLALTREMDLDVVFPGHGEPFSGHRELIDKRSAPHERRAKKLHALIAEKPRTAYELAQEIWGNIAATRAFLTLSEVLGHTDLLIRDGRVQVVDDGEDIDRFEAVQ